ncbi:MAG: tyrosine-type recombinase/integrase [Anaerolineae bacterium]|nr:tyrosine-type recombinase/integrase [Anaerolineae bacterium]
MKDAIERFKHFLTRRYPDRSTTKHYMSDLAIFSQFVGGKTPKDITPKLIDAFVQAQSQQGLKAATINRRLSAISSLFEFLISEAEDDGWHNPVFWKRHSIRSGRHLPRDVSDDLADQLLAVITDTRDRAMFGLMLGAGLRVGEVVALQLSDLHPTEATTGLTRLRVRGKGQKERVVWLTWQVMQQLHSWLQVRPQTNNPFLFLNQHGRPLSVAGVQFRLKEYCQQAHVHLTCHQLRHTFARRLAEHNMPIDSLAKLLGHANLQTTQLYIDGADPTVRSHFLQAMQQVAQMTQGSILNPGQPTLVQPPPSFTVQPGEERPDLNSLLDNVAHLAADLPTWLQTELRDHTLRRMSRWPTHRLKAQTHYHFSTLCRIGRWLVTERHWQTLDQLQRVDLVAYVNSRQEADLQPGSIAAELIVFRMFWNDLLLQEHVTNTAILQVKPPPPGDHLPRYLTLTEFQRLEQVVQTETQAGRPKDRLNQAWFYLLAHAGLRLSELLNLRLSDIDLRAKRLRIRSGKGDRDRVLPMTQQLATVLQDYLTIREPAATDHLLIYKGAALTGQLVPDRLERFGAKAHIDPMTPHRLRHTLATFLINQGMPITSLQKFLGHQDINKTLIYARVYDQTVRTQFAAAMAQVEQIAVPAWPAQITELAEALIKLNVQT